MAHVTTLMLSLVARAIVPFDYGLTLSDPNIGLLLFVCCLILLFLNHNKTLPYEVLEFRLL